jgi:hypothetical protein
MIAPIVQKAYDTCAVTVHFKLTDMHNGTASTAYVGEMKPYEIVDKSGKRFVVSCSVHLNDFKVNIVPKK